MPSSGKSLVDALKHTKFPSESSIIEISTEYIPSFFIFETSLQSSSTETQIVFIIISSFLFLLAVGTADAESIAQEEEGGEMIKLKGEELRENRRKRTNLWLSNPYTQNEELRKDLKEHPERWVDYFRRMASEWRNECIALDAELDAKENELKEKENELTEKETELKNKELSLSVDRLSRIEAINEQTRLLQKSAIAISAAAIAVTLIRLIIR